MSLKSFKCFGNPSGNAVGIMHLWKLWMLLFFPVFVKAQPINDECETATYLPIENYSYNFYCLEDSLDGADPDALINESFVMSAFPTVWYSFNIFQEPDVINIHFRSDDIEWPVLRLFQKSATCDDLHPVHPDIMNPGVTWLEGVDGKAEWIGLELTAGEYVLAITGLDQGEGMYTLCINHMAELMPVFQMQAHTPQVEWRGYGGPLDGPFFPGEQLLISTTVTQRQDAQGSCSWFQGLVPMFGQTWSYTSYDDMASNSMIDYQPCGQLGNGKFGTATWDWFIDDVYYNITSEHLKTGYFDDQLIMTTGLKSIFYDPFVPIQAENIFGGCCFPCWDGPVGAGLPPGWYCYGNDGNCNLEAPPIRHDWGDGESCTPTREEWYFELFMNVEEFIHDCDTDRDLDLTIAMTPMMENVIGAWNGGLDGVYDPYGFKRLRVVCDQPMPGGPLGPDTILYACYPDSLVLPMRLLNPYMGDVSFWKYNLDGPSASEPYAGFTPSDTLKVFPQMVSGNVLIYDGWVQAFSDPRHMIDQFYVVFYFYKRAPVADIIWEIKNGVVHFNQGTPPGELTFISWDFGDSTSSNQLKPQHMYAKEGKYTVTLIVSNPCGTDTIQEEILYVTDLPAPSMAISDAVLCQWDTVMYTSLSTGYIDSLAWQFEGGTPEYSNDSIVWVVYPETGTFDVSLTTYNPLGSVDQWIEDSITVLEHPVAEYKVSVYDSTYYCIYDGDPTHIVTWQFEDDALVWNDTLAQVIKENGTYPIKLWVENGCGRDSIFFNLDVIITTSHDTDPLFDAVIFPNPTTGSLWLITKQMQSSLQLNIYDLTGRHLWNQDDITPTESPIEISLDKIGIATGTYILEVTQGRKHTMIQFVRM